MTLRATSACLARESNRTSIFLPRYAYPRSVMEPFLGQIIMFAGNFAPRGWALCDGQLLPIGQNSALFAILGTTYGGDGQTNFALPDLRGRSPMHVGNGPGLPPVSLGQKFGSPTSSIAVANLPAHTHEVRCFAGPGNTNTAGGHVWSDDAGNQSATYQTGAATTPMGATALAPTGGNQALATQSPVLAVNFIIALTGIFPSRN